MFHSLRAIAARGARQNRVAQHMTAEAEGWHAMRWMRGRVRVCVGQGWAVQNISAEPHALVARVRLDRLNDLCTDCLGCTKSDAPARARTTVSEHFLVAMGSAGG